LAKRAKLTLSTITKYSLEQTVRILALETSGVAGGVAALEDDKLLAEIELDHQQRSAQSLAPALVRLLAEVGWRTTDTQLVAVTVGPGSFTGLRVGVTTAKLWAYAAGAAVLGVSTLHAIAMEAPPDVQALSVAIDAQRGDVMAQAFRRAPDGWPEPIGDEQLIPLTQWLGQIPQDFAIAGPILRKVAPLSEPMRVLDPAFWDPTARAVGRLAARLYQAGRRDDVWALAPRYSRRPAAEEKLEAKQGR
jgi:tRNA threonylcarbamoyladenosine biosynthesis protein TsaB